MSIRDELNKQLGPDAPADIRFRTPRSKEARAVGQTILLYTRAARLAWIQEAETNHKDGIFAPKELLAAASLFTSFDRFLPKLPILFGTRTTYEVDDEHSYRGLPYEYDPTRRGFIAMYEIRTNKVLEDYLKSLLTARHTLGTIPRESGAYSHLPVRPHPLETPTFYRTILTQTDGLVWFDNQNKDGRSVTPPHLMIFEQNKLESPKTSK